jgi:hypothetical protein
MTVIDNIIFVFWNAYMSAFWVYAILSWHAVLCSNSDCGRVMMIQFADCVVLQWWSISVRDDEHSGKMWPWRGLNDWSSDPLGVTDGGWLFWPIVISLMAAAGWPVWPLSWESLGLASAWRPQWLEATDDWCYWWHFLIPMILLVTELFRPYIHLTSGNFCDAIVNGGVFYNFSFPIVTFLLQWYLMMEILPLVLYSGWPPITDSCCVKSIYSDILVTSVFYSILCLCWYSKYYLTLLLRYIDKWYHYSM